MTIPRVQPETLAYFAGLFDGEGWIRVEVKEGSRGGTGVLHAGLGSTDLRVTADMRAMFGGYLTAQRISSRLSRRPARDWRATNDVAAGFLRAVYPYLRIKKRQAALAFKFRRVMAQNLRKRHLHRAELFSAIALEISALNQGRAGLVETVKGTPGQGEEPVQCAN